MAVLTFIVIHSIQSNLNQTYLENNNNMTTGMELHAGVLQANSIYKSTTMCLFPFVKKATKVPALRVLCFFKWM